MKNFLSLALMLKTTMLIVQIIGWCFILHLNAENIEDKILVISDLGRRMRLGEFYNARTNDVVPGKLWNQNFIDKYNNVTPADYTFVDVKMIDSFEERLELLDIGVEASFELVKKFKFELKVQGSFKYLNDYKSSVKSVKYASRFKTTTKRETLDIFNSEMLANVNRHVFQKQDDCDGNGCNLPTHVVSSITWGSNVVFSYEHLYKNSADRNLIDVGLKGLLKIFTYNIQAEIKGNFAFDENEKRVNDNTIVRVYGDLKMNEEIPTKPSEAVDFIERLPTLTDTAIGIGVPIEITLTPLVWIDSDAARLTRQIGKDIIDNVIEIYGHLEESEARINDLIALRYDGFAKWKLDADEYYREFKLYQSELLNNISTAADNYLLENGEIEDLIEVVKDYEKNKFNLLSIVAECEKRQDLLRTLLALASQFEPAQITFAQQLSDFYAPTFDIRYDTVYGLVVVGSDDAFRRREGINYVRDIVDLAEARKCDHDSINRLDEMKYCKDESGLDIIDNKIKHCKSENINGVKLCTNKEAYVAIHFDSFCNDLCGEEHCSTSESKRPKMFTDSTLPLKNDEDSNPFSKEWCSNPKTQILMFQNNGYPTNANEELPRVPIGLELHFDSEKDDLEVLSREQQIELHVTNINRETRDIKFIIAYYEPTHLGDKLYSYEKNEIEMNFIVGLSEKEEKFVKIGGLSAGQVYDISVIPKNEIGEGETTILPDVKIGDVTADITIKINAGNNETFEIEAHEYSLKSPLFPLWNDLDIGLELSIKSATKVAYVTLHKTIKNRNKATAYLSESDGVIKCNVVKGSFTSATCQIRDIDLEELDSNNIIDLNNNTILTLSIWDDSQQLIADKEVTIPKATKYRCKEFGGKKFCPKSPDLNVDGYKDFDRCVDDCESCDVRTDFLKHICVTVVPSLSPSDNPSLSPSV